MCNHTLTAPYLARLYRHILYSLGKNLIIKKYPYSNCLNTHQSVVDLIIDGGTFASEPLIEKASKAP